MLCPRAPHESQSHLADPSDELANSWFQHPFLSVTTDKNRLVFRENLSFVWKTEELGCAGMVWVDCRHCTGITRDVANVGWDHASARSVLLWMERFHAPQGASVSARANGDYRWQRVNQWEYWLPITHSVLSVLYHLLFKLFLCLLLLR